MGRLDFSVTPNIPLMVNKNPHMMKVNRLEIHQMIKELEQKLLDLLNKPEMYNEVLAEDPYYSWHCLDEVLLETAIKKEVDEFKNQILVI